ncbi:hypothetical protein ANCCAN_03057 [Ancylostoma caninum]|uniref:Uncharacterized protein n=1 Tax=Ancylostoma caninum TaxID=29170 RepID=A0A368H5C2_ANCCA|nr:hypothetical protein ANCCAN_03057 [Ancylostoma caninum]
MSEYIGKGPCSTIATLKYELNTTEELAKSITSYQVAEAAQKVLPIEIPADEQQFEELTVMVHRCTGLDNIRKGRFCKRRYLSISQPPLCKLGVTS